MLYGCHGYTEEMKLPIYAILHQLINDIILMDKTPGGRYGSYDMVWPGRKQGNSSEC